MAEMVAILNADGEEEIVTRLHAYTTNAEVVRDPAEPAKKPKKAAAKKTEPAKG